MGNCFSKGDSSKPSEKSPLAGKGATQTQESKPQNYSTSGVTDNHPPPKSDKPKTDTQETSPKKTASIPKHEDDHKESAPLVQKVEEQPSSSSESASPVVADIPITVVEHHNEPAPVHDEPEPVHTEPTPEPEPVHPEPTPEPEPVHTEPEPEPEPEQEPEPEPTPTEEPEPEPVDTTPEPADTTEEPMQVESEKRPPPTIEEPDQKVQKVDVCETCKTPLKPGQFANYEGKNYCRPHFKQLFMTGKVVTKQTSSSSPKKTQEPAPKSSLKDRLLKYAQEDAPTEVPKEEIPTETPKRPIIEKKPAPATPANGSERIECNLVTAVGVTWNGNFPARKTMEDEHKVVGDFGDNSAYFAIFDGHGGRDIVEYIAQHLHENIKTEGNFQSQNFVEAYLETEKQLLEQGIGVDNVNMGSTATTCVVSVHQDGTKWLHVANVGDTRAVLIRNGEALQVTYEHRPSDEQEVQRIKSANGWVVRNRVAGLLAVTRSFGHAEIKQWVLSEPFVYDVQLEETDSYLIIACDGLWDTISNQEAADLVLSEERDVKEISELLVKHALDAKTTDNVTVMVVKL